MKPASRGHDEGVGRLTDWFRGDESPVRHGVYRRRAPAGPYSCWTGRAWFGDADTPPAAAADTSRSRIQVAPWRGQAQSSDEVCGTCRGKGLLDPGGADEEGWPLVAPCPDC